jgi:ankyrin repeat-rich membrane spanning protein
VACLLYVYGPRNVFDSDIQTVDAFVIAILVVIGLAILGNIYTWSCMIINLAIPPRKRVQKIMSNTDSLKMEGLIQDLKKEVELLGHMTHCMDAFRHTHTRLVVIVDGLDSCEQEKLLQVLDTVHMLFSDDKSPFVTILAVDPHVIIKGIEHNLQGLFRDSSINGHDYLRNLVQLPFFLQSQTMPRTRYSLAKPERGLESTTSVSGKDHERHDRDSISNHMSVAYHVCRRST